MTEAELVQGLKDKDPAAWQKLVEQHQLLVYNVCNGFLHNAHDAEDLSQDIFIEVFNNAHKFRGDAKISTWLYRIAVNRSLNFIRNSRKRRFWKEIDALFGLSAAQNSTAFVPSVETAPMETSEQRSMLDNAISQLPKNQRIAFTLNKIEELPYAEVAEIMELSLSAIESLIYRARQNLRKKLKDYYK
ncbi:MAG: RNA polymerase sigma factor [Bacteroidales bacterium]|nr:RNA polymerase sigma factor [Bacteroidales bacterium]